MATLGKAYEAETPNWERLAGLTGNRPVYIREKDKEVPVAGVRRGDGPAAEILGEAYRTMYILRRRADKPGLTAKELALLAKKEGKRRTRPLNELFVGDSRIVTEIIFTKKKIVLVTTPVAIVANAMLDLSGGSVPGMKAWTPG